MLFNVIHEPYGAHNSIYDMNIVDFIVYHVRQNLWDPIISMPPRSQNWEEPGFSTETVTVLTEDGTLTLSFLYSIKFIIGRNTFKYYCMFYEELFFLSSL